MNENTEQETAQETTVTLAQSEGPQERVYNVVASTIPCAEGEQLRVMADTMEMAGNTYMACTRLRTLAASVDDTHAKCEWLETLLRERDELIDWLKGEMEGMKAEIIDLNKKAMKEEGN